MGRLWPEWERPVGWAKGQGLSSQAGRARVVFVSEEGKQSAPVQPLLMQVGPGLSDCANPPLGPCLGKASQVGSGSVPTCGSEGQMKESGCGRGRGLGVAVIPSSVIWCSLNFRVPTGWQSWGGLSERGQQRGVPEGASRCLGVRALPFLFV